MSIETTTVTNIQENQFHSEQVLPIVGAHFIHDIYTATVAPLLPVIIEKLSLSLTAAGSLVAIMQIPALLNPFIGYSADKISLRYFVIFAPAVTATFISSIGFAPGYWALAALLFATGISVACFHVPSPAMIARVAGNKVGLGMSLYMSAGELSRAVGPLLAVWAVTIWGLDGYYRIVILGWGTSLVLYFRLRHVPARLEKPTSISIILPKIKRLFIPLILINFFRNFTFVCLTTYLPTFLSMEGISLAIAAGALSILELAGVIGALTSGTISDRLGRKLIIFVATASSSILLLVFLKVEGWLMIPVLLALGFTTLSTAPVMLAMVQDCLPNNRAIGNGLFMFISFLIRPLAILTIGFIGDHFGLRTAFFISALLSFLAIPPVFALPSKPD